jgi:serine/threonine protein phosphatase PrpC
MDFTDKESTLTSATTSSSSINNNNNNNNRSNLKWQIGFDTDIGGGRENQDDCFVWSRPDEGLCVLCVLDGHGREVGKIAAEAAKFKLINYFEENHSQLVTNAYDCLVEAHNVAHEFVKESFRIELTKQGFEVIEHTTEGYLMKRRNSNQVWSCVHGGSSCSIVAIVGTDMYIANVGDSSGT